MATNKIACILPGDQVRFNAALAWIANVANKAVKKNTVTPDMVRDVLVDEHGDFEDLTYGIMGGTNAYRFIEALSQKSGAKIPGGLDRVFQAFFSSWDTALQCDLCGRLGVTANPNRDGVCVAPEPARCLGDDGCRGTLCDTSPKTEIKAWPDGSLRPYSERRYRYHDADYPIHDDDITACIQDRGLLIALTGVSISHFFRFCVATGALYERCNVNPNVRAIWEFLTGAGPWKEYEAVLGPVIQSAKNWKEGETKVEVEAHVRELLPQSMIHEIHRAFVTARLDRGTVTGQILASAIATAPSPSEQVGVDLVYLNDRTLPLHPMNGHPFVSWLGTAKHFSKLRKEEVVFRRALEAVHSALRNNQ